MLRSVRIELAFSAEALAGFFAALAAALGAADFGAAAFLAGAFLVVVLVAVFATGRSFHSVMHMSVRAI